MLNNGRKCGIPFLETLLHIISAKRLLFNNSSSSAIESAQQIASQICGLVESHCFIGKSSLGWWPAKQLIDSQKRAASKQRLSTPSFFVLMGTLDAGGYGI